MLTRKMPDRSTTTYGSGVSLGSPSGLADRDVARYRPTVSAMRPNRTIAKAVMRTATPNQFAGIELRRSEGETLKEGGSDAADCHAAANTDGAARGLRPSVSHLPPRAPLLGGGTAWTWPNGDHTGHVYAMVLAHLRSLGA